LSASVRGALKFLGKPVVSVSKIKYIIEKNFGKIKVKFLEKKVGKSETRNRVFVRNAQFKNVQ